MTPMSKPVLRSTLGSYRDGGKVRPIVVELGPGDLITFRMKGGRIRHYLPVESAFRLAQRITADAARREKEANRKNKGRR